MENTIKEDCEASDNEKPKQIKSRELVEKLTQELSEKHGLFHDTQKQPYIAIDRSGAKVMSLNGNDFKYWLLAEKMEAGEYISTHTIDEVAKRLQAIAVYKSRDLKPLCV